MINQNIGHCNECRIGSKKMLVNSQTQNRRKKQQQPNQGKEDKQVKIVTKMSCFDCFDSYDFTAMPPLQVVLLYRMIYHFFYFISNILRLPLIKYHVVITNRTQYETITCPRITLITINECGVCRTAMFCFMTSRWDHWHSRGQREEFVKKETERRNKTGNGGCTWAKQATDVYFGINMDAGITEDGEWRYGTASITLLPDVY